MFGWDLHMEMNDPKSAKLRKRADALMGSFEGLHWKAYYWHNKGTYFYYRYEMIPALKAMRRAKSLYMEGGATDDAVRAGIKEALILIELHRFKDAKSVITHLDRLRKNIESKNIYGEYCALKLAYHYHIRSSRSILHRHLVVCEHAFSEVKEVPVLLIMENLIMRSKARLGDVQGAVSAMKGHLNRLRKIVSNMPDRAFAHRFLDRFDERLLMFEYKLIEKKKGARTSRAPRR
jgi:hypothetical protein